MASKHIGIIHKESHKILVFSLALFFVMMRACYGAALTKFFTITIPPPFETERDVIQAYPFWHLKIRNGDEANVYSHVDQGDADYIAFWQRHTENPEVTTYNSDKEALQCLTNGQCVISSDENQFLGYLKTNPAEEKLHIFGQSRWQYRGLMFHLNSPLVPMFRLGEVHLREKGVEGYLHHQWIGVGHTESGSLIEMTVLTPGQVVTAFTFIMSIYMLSLLVLIGECLSRKVLKPANPSTYLTMSASTNAARRRSI